MSLWSQQFGEAGEARLAQRIWGTEVWMGCIRAMGNTVAGRGFINLASYSWQGKNGCRILGELCFPWTKLLVFCILIL